MTPEQLSEAGRLAGERFASQNWAENPDWVRAMASEDPATIDTKTMPFTRAFASAIRSYVEEREQED